MPCGPPPYDNGTLLCIPIYSPDAGHKDREAHTGGFFAVIHGNWKGVVTSQASLTRTLNRYPGARTFGAFTWSIFLVLWTLDCSEYHEHEYETPNVRARATLRVRQHLQSVAHYEHLVAADKEIQEEEAKRAEGGGEADKEGGDGVPGGNQAAAHSSESAMRVSIMRAEHASPSDDRSSPTATAPQASLITPPQTPARIAASNDYMPPPTTRLSRLPACTSVQEFETRQAPALARAVEVLKDTPRGELVFVGDEQNLWRFLDDQ
ncbi:hypothetical protein B0H14DRAFT_3463263 [Mycena olivaceomarginata]|nr:hypothetical protein B0H14DRAFT_3463263 [Mycena olivaceomarginata]